MLPTGCEGRSLSPQDSGRPLLLNLSLPSPGEMPRLAFDFSYSLVTIFHFFFFFFSNLGFQISTDLSLFPNIPSFHSDLLELEYTETSLKLTPV